VPAASWGRSYVGAVDTVDPIPLPGAFDPTAYERERCLIEIEAAIELVSTHSAVRISLVGFAIADEVARVGAARAQVARVGFHIERHERNSGRLIVVGPILTESAIRERP
jgi:hypothetical protein